MAETSSEFIFRRVFKSSPSPRTRELDYTMGAESRTNLNNPKSTFQPRSFDETTFRGRSFLFDWWQEIAALLFAAGLIVAIAVVLANFDGQELPNWPLRLNLSALVSLLSTIFKILTMATVPEVLGQLKWLWFSDRQRRLVDLQRLDSASRSVMGSFRLLFPPPPSVIAIVASLVTILAIIVDPFAQQAIRSVPCSRLVEDSKALIPSANLISGYWTRLGPLDNALNADMQAALVMGVANPQGNDSGIVPICPTGNCTFPEVAGITHSSIGLCSRCIDTSAAIRVNYSNECVPQPMLPTNISTGYNTVLSMGYSFDMDWAADLFTDEFAAVVPKSMINVSMLASSRTTNSSAPPPCLQQAGSNCSCSTGPFFEWPIAASCSIYSCLKRFHGEVVNGIFNETLVSTVPTSPTPFLTTNTSAVADPCIVDGEIYDQRNFSSVPKNHTFEDVTINGKNISVPYECIYRMEVGFSTALRQYMQEDLLTGGCETLSGITDANPNTIYCGIMFWLAPLFFEGNATFGLVSTAMEQFATAVTNKFRRVGKSLYVSDSQNDVNVFSAYTSGHVYDTTICTELQWPWLLMPVIWLLVAIVLLASTIAQTHYQPVWKTSILPLLYYGFDKRPDNISGPHPASISKLDNAASNINAYLDVRGPTSIGFVDVDKEETSDTDSLLLQRNRPSSHPSTASQGQWVGVYNSEYGHEMEPIHLDSTSRLQS